MSSTRPSIFSILARVDELLQAHTLVEEEGIDACDDDALEALAQSSRWKGRRMPEEIDHPAYSLRQVLTMLTHLRPEVAPPKLVTTLPLQVGIQTIDVARSLISSAHLQLLVFGYHINPDVINLLKQRARQGLRVDVVLDDVQNKGHLPMLLADRPDAMTIYRPVLGEARSMHAKVIVKDQQEALLGSANFTRSALNRHVERSGNWELGVWLEDDIPVQIHQAFEKMKARGFLEELTWQMWQEEQ